MIALRAAPPISAPETARSIEDLCIDRWHIVATRGRKGNAEWWDYTIRYPGVWGKMICDGAAVSVLSRIDGTLVMLGKLAKRPKGNMP